MQTAEGRGDGIFLGLGNRARAERLTRHLGHGDNGMTVLTEAEIRGHWQAAGIMRARTDRSDKTETRTTMGRIQ